MNDSSDKAYKFFHNQMYFSFTLEKIFQRNSWEVEAITSMVSDPLNQNLVIGVVLSDYSLDFVLISRYEVEELLRDPLNLAEFETVFAKHLAKLALVVKADLN